MRSSGRVLLIVESAAMATPFLQRVLHEPSYGWSKDGAVYKPSHRELFAEWRHRVNLLASRKAWLGVTGWLWTLALIPFGVVFLTKYLSWQLMLLGFLYSMVWIGTHGTVYLHRYSTHRAFRVRNAFYLFILRNLSIKIVPEETYVVSHHVHHAYSDQAGDPYNATAGWLYCFLAAEIHQSIRRDFTPAEYEQSCLLVRHTGMRTNSYAQYQRWGSLAHPARLYAHYALNWAFWYGAFYLLGGHALATALFGWAAVWGIGIRAHNYDLHAGGQDRRRDGIDFDRKSLAINALWPGLVAGEWHNNHHLYPQSVRAGFLWWQFDISFAFIRVFRLLGGVTQWLDARDKFFERHYAPYLAGLHTGTSPIAGDLDEVDEAGQQ
jgi:sn-1 stearoyl-lipid 9-desaturase